MASISKKKIALIEKYNQEKLRNQAMQMGVMLKSPETVFLSNDIKFGKNVTINPYVVIGKKTKNISLKKLSSNQLYGPKVTKLASIIAKKKYVRFSLKKFQKNFEQYDIGDAEVRNAGPVLDQ